MTYPSKARISGQCAEDFCLQKFGIKEDQTYEIKSSAWHSYQIVVKCIQLLGSFDKQYVIVRYRRKYVLNKKGNRKFTESIPDAFRSQVVVYVVRGIDLMKIIIATKARCWNTKFESDGNWAPYWIVHLRDLSVVELKRDSETVILGNELDPPKWLGGANGSS